ncbi:MAG: class I tRNA ligase family protein, partial [Candidatus Neomarinimicrobiota bacterium]
AIHSSNDKGLDINGLNVDSAVKKTINWLEKQGIGSSAVNYKLRDWVFSRQRYWGEPIPLIHCEECGWIAVPEEELPVKLPEVEKFEPTETGESPLAAILDWVNIKCPKCGKNAKRETDTMPNWAGSSWYFLRYIDPKNDKEIADLDKLKYWMPVDWYNGGMEHTTLHLLYSRFWNKFLYDCGIVPVSEPYLKRTSHGMLLGEGGTKMSKSRDNVINPDDVVEQYGADVFRMYEMFIGPFDQSAAWDTKGIVGIDRFIKKVWRFVTDSEIKDIKPDKDQQFLIHNTIKLVTKQIDTLDLNTAISQIMIFVNELSKENKLSKNVLETLLLLLSPFAPHISEELWQYLGHSNTLAYQSWPKYKDEYLMKKTILIPIQVNGKVRDKIEIDLDQNKEIVLSNAKKCKNIIKYLKDSELIKEIYVPNKIINFVVR